MKNFVVLFVAMLLAAGRLSAQVLTVEVQLESDQYLPNEPLIAKVRINNATGQTLRLGDEPDWLSFVIETSEGGYVTNLRPVDVVGGFNLESSHTANKKVDLAPAFNLTQLGRYKVVATVKVPRFGSSYASSPKIFFISTGKPLWEKVFGVPAAFAVNAAEGEPEVRKYVLVQALSGSDARLYARVTDRLEQNIRVVALGKLVSFSKPEPQVDKWSNLHVIFETGARTFVYHMINPDGFVIARETHEYTHAESRPALVSSDEGRIAVRGGQRKITVDDIPPVETAQFVPPIQPLPVQTNLPDAKNKKANQENAKNKKK